MKRGLLILTVFICGAALMILELVGSRLLAPFVGTSLIVWTTLIGVILAALSFGYWAGGRYADKNPLAKHLGVIIIFSGFFTLLALWVSSLLPKVNLFLLEQFSLGGAALIISIVLFVIPSILLGAVSPFALRLSLDETKNSGTIAGKLYAFSTLGSIVGTFLAGFVLIPNLGSFKTLVLISIILVLCGFIFVRNKFSFAILIFVLFGGYSAWFNAFLFSPSQRVLAEYESAYNRLLVVAGIDNETSRPIISLMTGPHISQSAAFTNSDELVFEYTKFFRLADYFNPNIKRALMLGGGAYSFPKDYLKTHDAAIDVVEIDPLYTELANIYFNLADNEKLNIYHEDARVFLSSKHETYDAIYVDVFNNTGSVPFQLATTEAIKAIYNKLSTDGVVIVNLIGSFDGLGSKFIASELATYKSVFSQVKIFPLKNPGGANVQNIMLVALKNSNQNLKPNPNLEQKAFLDKEYKYQATAKILTDDWAPVDYYLSGLY